MKCRWLEVVAIDFVLRFFRLSVPAVVGGVVEDVRTGQNKKKKWHSLREVRVVGKRVPVCAADIPRCSWMASGKLDAVKSC